MYGEAISDENSGNGSLLNRVKASFLTRAADLAWRAVQAINTRLPEGELPNPKWAPGRIAKSRERSAPPLGFPRETDSLCPRCVPELRREIVEGHANVDLVLKENPGQLKAQLVEENGRILIRKTCEKHGAFEDVLSTYPAFTRRIESLFFGRDFSIRTR